MVLAYELKGSEVAEGLMGTDGVVDVIPVEKGLIKGGHYQVSVVALMELFGMDALGPSHVTIELGASVGQDAQPYTQVLTGDLKLGLELTAPVHLDGLYGEREQPPHRTQ